MESNELPKLTLEGMVQLDPETCGSSIRWFVQSKATVWKDRSHVHKGRQFSANVHLTDCSRQITWSADHGDRENVSVVILQKLDRAIKELSAMRDAVLIATQHYNGLPVSSSDVEAATPATLEASCDD